MLEMIGKGLVIFITPTGYRQSDYCTAARYLFEGIPEFDWVENGPCSSEIADDEIAFLRSANLTDHTLATKAV
ncbi:hypothetical protein [Rhizobium mongolense]|uniref:Uncharacterized protein n=1 Tax=Rhizobium mongolense TaxID=57676 RepID=A0A7W6RI00_9HYPH|nr:hypothetical protein [Rhizobium mongolense]MBB4272848.1 hypothetical protein [Rhizobium mongolense]